MINIKTLLITLLFLVVLISGCSDKQIACTEDARICPDGSSVVRSGPDCEFAECPPITEYCTLDAKICPDGSAVGRTGPNCEFAECPEIKPMACTEEAMECPDGSAVGRTGPNCEFAECPEIV